MLGFKNFLLEENDWLLYFVAYVYNHVPIMKCAVGWT